MTWCQNTADESKAMGYWMLIHCTLQFIELIPQKESLQQMPASIILRKHWILLRYEKNSPSKVVHIHLFFDPAQS